MRICERANRPPSATGESGAADVKGRSVGGVRIAGLADADGAEGATAAAEGVGTGTLPSIAGGDA